MNNLVHLNVSDPIFDEYEAFVDKAAGIKTIAFKYFGADMHKATSYLELDDNKTVVCDNPQPIQAIQPKEYYQLELFH
jgi:hypothetical protein